MMARSFSENTKFEDMPKNLEKLQTYKEKFEKLSFFECKCSPPNPELENKRESNIESYYYIS